MLKDVSQLLDAHDETGSSTPTLHTGKQSISPCTLSAKQNMVRIYIAILIMCQIYSHGICVKQYIISVIDM